MTVLERGILVQNSNPWWMNDPELVAGRQRALEELERGIDECEPNSSDEPDPVVAEIYSGEVGRALSAARDDLAAARQRYEDAVFAARTAGFSWTEIGRLLGVSRQQVHRQYRAPSTKRARRA
jgi:DNA-directed RNA polymerase specialized sigma24 family protein